MNEELETRLKSYLDTLEQSVTAASDFTAEQMPLLVQEYLAWYWASSIMGVVSGFLLLSLGLTAGYFIKRLVKHLNTKNVGGFEGEASSIFIVVLSFVLVLSTVFGCWSIYDNTHSLIKVTMAPRIVLLEKVGEIVNVAAPNR